MLELDTLTELWLKVNDIDLRRMLTGRSLPICFYTRMRRSSYKKKGKRKDQGVPQSQTAALPRHQEEEKTDKSKQAQIEKTYEKH